MSNQRIPYGRQSIDEADIDAVVRALRSDFLTQGPLVETFERDLLAAVGSRGEAVVVNSATSALHIAALALGLKPGKRLWTVPNTFVATANCARYCGAEVDFIDIEAGTYAIDADALEARLAVADQNGALPDVVAAVDFAGQPCAWEKLIALKRQYGFRLIDDASHALGARYQGWTIGANPDVDVTIFSFHPVKIVATGEGGAAFTHDSELAHAMRLYRSHGIVRDEGELAFEAPGPWYYEQQQLGYNYRMTELQAALGISQLTKLPSFLARRREIAERYDHLLAGVPVETPVRREETLSAWHLYTIHVDEARHRAVFDGLRAGGIGVQLHYVPVHLHPYYRALGFSPGQFPMAEAHARRAISLPMFPALTNEEQQHVVDLLSELLGRSEG